MNHLHDSWRSEQADKAEVNRVKELEALFKIMRSYNPDLPMAPGMKAQFQFAMHKLETVS